MKWILLEFFNDYDQHGGYFAGVFNDLSDLKDSIDHLGRIDFESSWYRAVEVEVGCVVHESVDGDLIGDPGGPEDTDWDAYQLKIKQGEIE